MDDGLTGLFLWGQVLEHAEDLRLHITKEVVENLIGQEFLYIFNTNDRKMTYDWMALQTLLVKVVKLGLALIEVIQISTLNGDPGVSFIDLEYI